MSKQVAVGIALALTGGTNAIAQPPAIFRWEGRAFTGGVGGVAGVCHVRGDSAGVGRTADKASEPRRRQQPTQAGFRGHPIMSNGADHLDG
jgi:hypothetical protein